MKITYYELQQALKRSSNRTHNEITFDHYFHTDGIILVTYDSTTDRTGKYVEYFALSNDGEDIYSKLVFIPGCISGVKNPKQMILNLYDAVRCNEPKNDVYDFFCGHYNAVVKKHSRCC